MGLYLRNYVCGISDHVRLKPACSTIEIKLEYMDWNFAWSKFDYYTFQTVNNKGADQTARMLRMVCTFVVCTMPKKSFSRISAHAISS